MGLQKKIRKFAMHHRKHRVLPKNWPNVKFRLRKKLEHKWQKAWNKIPVINLDKIE
jgi:hypothetical protein